MDIRKKFGINRTFEDEGVEVRLDVNASVILARAGGGNVQYDKAMKKHFGPYRRAIDAGTLDDSTATILLQRVYADSVVLNWRNLELDGEGFEYSHENVLRVFKDFPDFWKIIEREATKMQNFLQEDVRETGKDSPMS